MAELGKGTIEFQYSENWFEVIFSRTLLIGSVKRSGIDSVKIPEKILELIKLNSKITIPELAQSLGISTRAIEKNLKSLKSANKLERLGSAGKGEWKLKI